jgi:hypothetical protein
MPDISNSSDIAGNDGQIVTVTGVYAIQDLGRYRIVSTLADGSELQSSMLSYLKLADGSQVRLGARPEAEHDLKGKTVVATGVLREQWPPRQDPKVAQPDAEPTLLEITSVVASE